MARYHAIRGTDGRGDRYATGPLCFLETDDAGKAQRWVHGNGGEVVDVVGRQAWSPAVGWVELDEEDVARLVQYGTIPGLA